MKYVKQLVLCLLTIALLMHCADDGPEEMEVDCSTSDLSVSVIASTQPGCTTTGDITVAGSGGTTPYMYSINGVDFQSETVFSDLIGGSITVTIMDADGCTNQASFTLETEGNAVSLSTQASDSECLQPTGTITVTASGGDGAYQYTLDGGAQQASNVFENVEAGPHEVTVVDGEGCEAAMEVQVSSGVSLADDIMPLLQTQCTFSGCHNGDNGSDRNWTVKSNVIARAQDIKDRTGNGSMPRSPGVLTQDEIDLIACWVDDGAKDN